VIENLLWHLGMLKPRKIKPSCTGDHAQVITNLKSALTYYSHEEKWGVIARDALKDAKNAGF
jgi:hypothetical protein